MADRRRLAVVAAPPLGLLAALLLGWGVAAAQAPDPLALSITAERSECTAGTLNPVTWEIRGGTPPYTLTIDGASVDADAESATITCGALPDGASEAPATITAVVTDAAGEQRTASTAYRIAPPLPALRDGEVGSAFDDSLRFVWRAVGIPRSDHELVAVLVRWREVGSAEWSYRSSRFTAPSDTENGYWVDPWLGGLREGVAYEAAVAAMRHPLEAETPEALHWTPSQQATTVTSPANVTVNSTHDTVTVRWDRQPSVTYWVITLYNPDYSHDSSTGIRIPLSSTDPEAWGDPESGRHEVTFRHLVPDTEYSVWVGFGYEGSYRGPAPPVDVTVRTKAAPAGFTPLPRGPQNLRATATHDAITVTWDPPFEGARPLYGLSIFGPDGRRLCNAGVHYPPWTFTFTSGPVNGGPRPCYLAPETTYRVSAHHHGIVLADAEIRVATPAAPLRLRLALTAERAECTAATLNPVTWEISGGTPPYTLIVDGEPVDADAESATVTCWAPATISAVVTDADGTTAAAHTTYTVVPPLPAPTGLSLDAATAYAVWLVWDAVDGAGSQSPLDQYLFRYRDADAEATAPYELTEPLRYPVARVQPGPLDYLGMAAAIRHPIERETPGALNWSASVLLGLARAAQNIVVQATYDTVTVSWDAQPYAQTAHAWLVGGGVHLLRSNWEITTTAGRRHAGFRHLTPETEYEIEIWTGDGTHHDSISTATTARTLAAPADFEPLLRGPQNLRATATYEDITLYWDLPFPDAPGRWFVSVTTIVDGTTWSVDRLTARVPGSEGLTIRGTPPWGIWPDTTYRILVAHDGFDSAFAEITVTTPGAPGAASATCFDYGVGPTICT